MLNDRHILAVIPARGGSKGIVRKNLRPVGGIPLVARVGRVCKELAWLDRAVVSTDDDEIAKIAEGSGLDAPFRRPVALSGDLVGDWDVLNHALLECERLDSVVYDVVLMLQPTSPLRMPEHVEATVRLLLDGGLDSVWTVSETDSKAHPLKQLKIHNGELSFYAPEGAGIIARQQLEPVYHRNGIAYAMTRECLVSQKSIKGKCSGACILQGDFVSIDTEWDITLVEMVLKRDCRW